MKHTYLNLARGISLFLVGATTGLISSQNPSRSMKRAAIFANNQALIRSLFTIKEEFTPNKLTAENGYDLLNEALKDFAKKQLSEEELITLSISKRAWINSIDRAF